MQRAAVVRRGNRDRLDPESSARLEDPERDLAAVRYEQPPNRHGGGS
jgi:hypothetical protein